jgi:hypothetical protein
MAGTCMVPEINIFDPIRHTMALERIDGAIDFTRQGKLLGGEVAI